MFRAKPWIKALGQVALLSGCPKKELACFDSKATELRLPAGTVLLDEESVGRQVFMVAKGTVAIKASGGASRALGPGAFLGEVGLLDPAPEASTITTVTEVTVYVMHKGEFQGFVDEAPTVRQRLESIPADPRVGIDAPSSAPNVTPLALASSA